MVYPELSQPHLYEDIERAFDKALDQGEPGVDFTECQTEGPRKGRQETRTCCVITNPIGDPGREPVDRADGDRHGDQRAGGQRCRRE